MLTPEQDALVVHALRQVVERGTATAARIGVPAAGKTGTTQDNLDAWFIGFTPNALTAAVWMGYEPVDTNGDGIKDPRFMSDVHGRAVTGGSFPAEIWRKFMSEWVAIVGGEVGRFPSVSSFPGDGAQLRPHDDDVDVAAVPGRREHDDRPVRHDDHDVDDDDVPETTTTTAAAGDDHDRRRSRCRRRCRTTTATTASPTGRPRPRCRARYEPQSSGSVAPTSWWG